MRYLAGSEVTSNLGNVIHDETQQHDYETDLTVGAIFRVTGPGALDFGGSEYAEASRQALQPEKAAPDDKYGWWELEPGTYIVRFNETIRQQDRHIAFIQPHERLLLAGGYHPAYHLRDRRDQLETILIVGEGGLRMKENARLSKLLIFHLGN